MITSVMTSKISLEKFLNLKDELMDKLLERLKDLNNIEFDNPPEGDLWNLPKVDSKTVVKLSPLVEEDTGMKLINKWVKRGGYGSEEEAIKDLIEKIEKAIKGN